MAKVLITGGAGFIGSNLTEFLLKRGHSVRVLDNFSTGKRENLQFEKDYPGLDVVHGDVIHPGVCRSAVREMAFVFHLAALPSVQQSLEDPLTSHRVNTEGTLNLLLAARDAKVRRIIYASSCAVYGDDPVLPKREEMAPCPLSPYALQKYEGEQYCRLFSRLYHLETVSLRYFNVFGPKQDPNSLYSAAIPRFIDALIRGVPPVVFGDGEQSRDFVFIEDILQGNLLAMEKDRTHGEVVNICSGKDLSLNRLLALLGDFLKTKVAVKHLPVRPGDVRHSLGDTGRADQFLGYHPRVPVEVGIEKTVMYFIKKRRENRNNE